MQKQTLGRKNAQLHKAKAKIKEPKKKQMHGTTKLILQQTNFSKLKDKLRKLQIQQRTAKYRSKKLKRETTFVR